MISKKGWYKIAIKQKELYDLYSLAALSDEAFANHPELLYDFINKMNEIREYYLTYLLDQISGELYYVKPSYEAAKITNSEEDENFYDKLNDIILKLEYCVNNLDSCNLSNVNFDKIMHYFNDLKWESAFGGKLWGDITYWTKELYNFSPITNFKYSPVLMQKIRRLFMILDTINSLHHNTGSVLNDLPNDEFQWLIYGLENIKDAENPIELAYLSGNQELADIYKREEFPFFERTKAVSDKMNLRLQVSKMSKEKKKELAKIENNPLFLEVLMDSLRHDIFSTINTFSANPYVAAYPHLVKKLINKMEEMDYNDILIRENLYYIVRSDFITNETAEIVMDYMSQFYGRFNEPLSELLIENPNISIDEGRIRKILQV